MIPTLGQLYDFVIANRTNKCFTNMTNERVLYLLQEGIDNGLLFYATGTDDAIIGMILARENKAKKEIYIIENLAMSLNTLKEFAKKAKATWPDHRLVWDKHGIYKQYDTSKVYKKLAI